MQITVIYLNCEGMDILNKWLGIKINYCESDRWHWNWNSINVYLQLIIYIFFNLKTNCIFHTDTQYMSIYTYINIYIVFSSSGLKQRALDLFSLPVHLSPLRGSQGLHRPAEMYSPSGMSWISWRRPQQMPMSPPLTHFTRGVAVRHSAPPRWTSFMWKAEPDKVVSAVCTPDFALSATPLCLRPVMRIEMWIV